MRFRILGALEVWENGRQLVLGGPQQRAVLAVLLLHPNRVVSANRLIECLWGEQPPATARSLLQGCVAQVRRRLRSNQDGAPKQPLLTRSPGYVLHVGPGELDLDRFSELDAAARRLLAGHSRMELEQAAVLLHEALSLWRGPVLDGIDLDAYRAEVTQLEERRLAVLEERIDVDLLLGGHARLVGELQAHVRAHPLRERLCAQLMLALYGDDRQAEALAAYRQLRHTLVEQLAVEPSATLQQLERAILTGADALASYRLARATPEGEPGRRPESADPGRPPAVRDEPAAADHVPQAPGLAAPAQLPAATAAFTGRAQHLKQLDELLSGEGDTARAALPVAVISGTAGVGKTTLAVHWAHQVRDRFGDGQLYVNLRGYASVPPVRPIEALAGFLQALGVPPGQLPVDVEQAAALYRTLLANRRVLVVLDNAGSAEQVRPLLPGNPGCLALVTSRDRLGGLVARDGARHLTLDVLTIGEARVLLACVLGPERVQAEAAEADELTRLCAYLPLALRIAAANLTCDPGRGIADHVAELREGNRLGTLAVDGDEQTAVRAAFDLSYATVAPEARRVFRLLSLAPGPDVTQEAAAALAGITPGQAGRLLHRLAGAHLLIQPSAGRFAFHDLLRLYAAERAHDEDTPEVRQAVTRRLLDWCLGTVDAAARLLYPMALRLPPPPADTRPAAPPAPVTFDDHAAALAWLDAELANLMAAVQHTAEYGPRPVAWRLADALRGFFVLRGDPVDWLTIAHAGLAAARSDGDLAAQAAAQLSLADAWLRQTRFDRSIDHYHRALALAGQTGWLEGQSAALGNLGNAYLCSGRLREAADHYTRALTIDRQTGWLPGMAVKLSNLGIVCRDLGQLARAADYLAETVTLFRQLDSRIGEATSRVAVGETYHALGRFSDALDQLTVAAALRREIGDLGSEANSLVVLAAVHRDAGRHRQALELAQAALVQARDSGERRFEADALNTLASVHDSLGQHRQAADGHQQALDLARRTGTRYPELVALIGLAAVHQHLYHPDQARVLANQAVALAGRSGHRLLEGQALTVLADVHLALGQPDEAISYARRALAVHCDTGHRLGEARTLLVLGHALRDTGGADSAVRQWQQASAILAEIGVVTRVQPPHERILQDGR